jgi:hypothetical protein
MPPALVSCLCVTEGRPAFMPWLLWSFNRQSWPRKELVIVDSSPEPLRIAREDVRVIAAPPGTNIPEKRNRALAASRGDLVAWFDDDDWQHPERLARLVAAIVDEGRPLAGASQAWFVDVFGSGCRRYDGRGSLVFNSAGFRRDLACSIPFNVGLRRASDTLWMRRILASAGGGKHLLPETCLTLWLCHDQNISNPRTRRAFPLALEQLRAEVGPDAWADTDARLEQIRGLLPPPLERSTRKGPRTRPRVPRRPALQTPGPAQPRLELPALLGTTPALPAPGPLAAPADVTLVMLAGAAERALVDHALAHVRRQAGPVPRHTQVVDGGGEVTTGALIQALEGAPTEMVLLAAPTVLFHADGVSWVAEAASRLVAEPALLLVTTQAGPPAGAAGSPRTWQARIPGAVWDAAARLWRHHPRRVSHGVARRTPLLEALRALAGDDPSAAELPWTFGVRAALEAAGALQAALAIRGSWALEVRGQAPGEWMPALAAAVERGRYPICQKGRPVADLDTPLVRQGWRDVIAADLTSTRAA